MAIPLRDDSGKLIGLLGIFTDITARKLAEQKLRESEKKFRTLADNIPQLCWMANADGWIFWYNNRWYEYTGTTPEQMEGWGWQSVQLPEALPQVMEQWQAALATGKPFDMVFPLRGSDGIFRPFLTRGLPVFDQDGKLERWFGTNTDITEQKQVEGVLRESEELFHQLAEGLPLLVWTCQPDGPCDYLNQRWIDYTGVPAEEQLGFLWLNFLYPEDREYAIDVWMKAVQQDADYDVEFRLRRHDGVYRYFKNTAIQMRDSNGKTVKWFGASTDIDDIKQAEKSLVDYRDHLQELVEQRTQQLEESNQDLESFSYSISHDLRAPLRAIDGFSKIVVDIYADKLDDEGRRLLNVVSDNTRKMGQLIDDILRFSRAGRTALTLSVIDMESLFHEVLEELKPTFSSRIVNVTIAPLPKAKGDRALIYQVVINLLANAVKFTSKAGIAQIDVGTVIEGKEPVYFVSDNGVGFDIVIQKSSVRPAHAYA